MNLRLPDRVTIVRIVTTVALVLASLIFIYLYLGFKQELKARAEVRGFALPAVSKADAPLLMPPRDGPFVVNGMKVSFSPYAPGQGGAAMKALSDQCGTEGWRRLDPAKSPGPVASVCSSYEVYQKGDEIRTVMNLDWLSAMAMCQVSKDQPVVMPLDRLGADGRDVPGNDLPGVCRPEGSRRIFEMSFPGGALICYDLKKAGGADLNTAIERMRVSLQAMGWKTSDAPVRIGICQLLKPDGLCWIWSQQTADGEGVVAIYLIEKGADHV